MATARDLGQSVHIRVITNQQQFDTWWPEFVESMGRYPFVGINCKWNSPNVLKQMQRLNFSPDDAECTDSSKDQVSYQGDFDSDAEYDGDHLTTIRDNNARRGAVSLIQLASFGGNVLLFRSCFFKSLPESLRCFLQGRVVKVGQGLERDRKQLTESFYAFTCNFVDVRQLYLETDPHYTAILPQVALRWPYLCAHFDFSRFGVRSLAQWLFGRSFNEQCTLSPYWITTRLEADQILGRKPRFCFTLPWRALPGHPQSANIACLARAVHSQKFEKQLIKATAEEAQLYVDVFTVIMIRYLGWNLPANWLRNDHFGQTLYFWSAPLFDKAYLDSKFRSTALKEVAWTAAKRKWNREHVQRLHEQLVECTAGVTGGARARSRAGGGTLRLAELWAWPVPVAPRELERMLARDATGALPCHGYPLVCVDLDALLCEEDLVAQKRSSSAFALPTLPCKLFNMVGVDELGGEFRLRMSVHTVDEESYDGADGGGKALDVETAFGADDHTATSEDDSEGRAPRGATAALLERVRAAAISTVPVIAHQAEWQRLGNGDSTPNPSTTYSAVQQLNTATSIPKTKTDSSVLDRQQDTDQHTKPSTANDDHPVNSSATATLPNVVTGSGNNEQSRHQSRYDRFQNEGRQNRARSSRPNPQRHSNTQLASADNASSFTSSLNETDNKLQTGLLDGPTVVGCTDAGLTYVKPQWSASVSESAGAGAANSVALDHNEGTVAPSVSRLLGYFAHQTTNGRFRAQRKPLLDIAQVHRSNSESGGSADDGAGEEMGGRVRALSQRRGRGLACYGRMSCSSMSSRGGRRSDRGGFRQAYYGGDSQMSCVQQQSYPSVGHSTRDWSQGFCNDYSSAPCNNVTGATHHYQNQCKSSSDAGRRFSPVYTASSYPSDNRRTSDLACASGNWRASGAMGRDDGWSDATAGEYTGGDARLLSQESASGMARLPSHRDTAGGRGGFREREESRGGFGSGFGGFDQCEPINGFNSSRSAHSNRSRAAPFRGAPRPAYQPAGGYNGSFGGGLASRNGEGSGRWRRRGGIGAGASSFGGGAASSSFSGTWPRSDGYFRTTHRPNNRRNFNTSRPGGMASVKRGSGSGRDGQDGWDAFNSFAADENSESRRFRAAPSNFAGGWPSDY